MEDCVIVAVHRGSFNTRGSASVSPVHVSVQEGGREGGKGREERGRGREEGREGGRDGKRKGLRRKLEGEWRDMFRKECGSR